MTGPVLEPRERACSDASWIIPLGLALPYVWRLVQCVRVFLDTGARPQLFNALKYSTAFPVRRAGVAGRAGRRLPGLQPSWKAAVAANHG